MKIIFLGTPDFAIPSLQKILSINWIELLAVCTQPDRPSGRGNKILPPPVKVFALENNILLFQTEKISKDHLLIEKFKNLKPDYLITCAFGQILNQDVLDICPVLNVHASLLPKYRGAAPINYAILNGEKETGISIMKTELGLDSGPVLIQEKCNIGENETSVELTEKLSVLGGEALIKGLDLLKNMKGNFVEQDESLVSKAPSLKKELGLIDFSKTNLEIHNKVRGLQPWPTAYTTYNGQTIKIWETKITSHENLNFSIGEIIEIKDFIRVQTGKGTIDIYKVQPENKKIMNVKDWVNGSRVKTGSKFI